MAFSNKKLRARLKLRPSPITGTGQIVDISVLRMLEPDDDISGRGCEAQLAVRLDTGEWLYANVAPSAVMEPNRLIDHLANELGRFPEDKVALARQIRAAEKGDHPRLKYTEKSGWRPSEGRVLGSFVLPQAVNLLATQPYHFDLARAAGQATKEAFKDANGTLARWRTENARLLSYSSVGVAALGATMAATLLPISDVPEGMVILLAGESSTGKSTIQFGAMSFQGRGDKTAAVSPASSVRAYEEIGANHNHLMLPVDDLSQCTSREVREFVRMLVYRTVGGGGRTVSRNVQNSLPTKQFSTVVLATSENSAAEIARSAGDGIASGETVRLFDLIIPPAAQGGVFDRVPSNELRSTAELSEALQLASVSNYGVAHAVWLKWLQRTGGEKARALVSELSRDFVDRASDALSGSSEEGRQRRVMQKFGLMYAALCLGRKAEVIPWSKSHIRSALMSSLSLSQGEASSAPAHLIERFRNYACIHGRTLSKHELTDGWDKPSSLCAIVMRSKGEWALVHPRKLRSEFGVEANQLVSALESRGVMRAAKGVKRVQVRLPGTKERRRYYELDPSFLE